MGVERATSELRALHEVVQRNTIISVFGEEVDRAVENALPSVERMLLGIGHFLCPKLLNMFFNINWLELACKADGSTTATAKEPAHMPSSSRDSAVRPQHESNITLYYSPGACSLAIHIVLEELNIPYQLKLVSVAEGKASEPEFLSVNPKGRVPVLEIDDVLLTEAPAILVYLARVNPESALLPSEQLDIFRCLEWLNWLSSTVHAVGYGQLWRPERFTNDSTQFENIIAKGRENITDAYRHIEKLLTRRSWSVGDTYSCVDPFLLVFYLWGNAVGFSMQTEYPAWSAHAARILVRDAVRRAIEQEGLTLPPA